MPIRTQQVDLVRRTNGSEPFSKWLFAVESRHDRVRIQNRLNRLRGANFGDTRSAGSGVFEVRMHHGPGYRVYFGRLSDAHVVSLRGGTKATQRRDVAQARLHWQEFIARLRDDQEPAL